MKVLYTTESIQRAIREVLRPSRGRRVVMVAFIGDGAEALLPRPDGMEIYCWPAASTSAKAVRRLAKRAQVFFSKKLHMKVYWSQRGGAVVTSANLSANALGRGGLREVGVHLPPGRLLIDRLIASAKGVRVTEAALGALQRLNDAGRTGPRVADELRAFSDTFGVRKLRWKLAIVGGTVASSRRLRESLKDEVPRGIAHSWISCRRDEFREGDFVLTVDVGKGKSGTHLESVEWLFVQRRVLVAKTDPAYDEGNPYQVAQVFAPRLCKSPPFRIDGRFRGALGRVIRDWDMDALCELRSPLRSLVQPIKREYEVGA